MLQDKESAISSLKTGDQVNYGGASWQLICLSEPEYHDPSKRYALLQLKSGDYDQAWFGNQVNELIRKQNCLEENEKYFWAPIDEITK